jgi:hypothetical protein
LDYLFPGRAKSRSAFPISAEDEKKVLRRAFLPHPAPRTCREKESILAAAAVVQLLERISCCLPHLHLSALNYVCAALALRRFWKHTYTTEANSTVLFCSPRLYASLFVCFDRTAVIVMIDEMYFDTSSQTRKDF